jgi:murein L,D-transpeptidase YcbB/YkuD
LLGKENGWTEERIRKLIGGKNETIHLPHAVDIHIGYYTAFVDEAGKLQLREDIYGYSAKVRAALGLDG